MGKGLNFSTILLLLFTYIIWGGNTVAMKFALAAVAPLFLAGSRIGLTIGVFYLWNSTFSVPLRSRGNELLLLVLNGTLFALHNGLFVLGMNLSLASRATVLINTYPFFVATFAHFFLPGDRLNLRKFAGLCFAFAGIAAVFMDREVLLKGLVLGDILIMVSVLLLAARIMLVKKLVLTMAPSKLLFWASIISAPIFFLASRLIEGLPLPQVTPWVLFAVFYMGLMVSGFCYFVQTTLLKSHNPSIIVSFAFITPISGLALSAWILNEPVTHGLLAGAILVGLGLFVINYRGSSRRVSVAHEP
ncbi:MAG: DMT family transporter [Thermodesulfobacteriota bacterium]